MLNHKVRARKYGNIIYAALLFLVFVIAYFIYSFFASQSVNTDDYVIEINEDGIMEVSPGEDAGPDYLPDVTPPTSPPPGN